MDKNIRQPQAQHRPLCSGDCRRRLHCCGYHSVVLSNFEDVLLIKTDAAGETLWEKTFGGQSWDRCHTVRQTDDGGYILAGSSRLKEESNADTWLLKTDAVGNPLWQQTFESVSSDEVTSLQITSDGGFVLAGSSASMDGSPADLLLIKTDARGTIPLEPEENPQRLGFSIVK